MQAYDNKIVKCTPPSSTHVFKMCSSWFCAPQRSLPSFVAHTNQLLQKPIVARLVAVFLCSTPVCVWIILVNLFLTISIVDHNTKFHENLFSSFWHEACGWTARYTGDRKAFVIITLMVPAFVTGHQKKPESDGGLSGLHATVSKKQNPGKCQPLLCLKHFLWTLSVALSNGSCIVGNFSVFYMNEKRKSVSGT